MPLSSPVKSSFAAIVLAIAAGPAFAASALQDFIALPAFAPPPVRGGGGCSAGFELASEPGDCAEIAYSEALLRLQPDRNASAFDDGVRRLRVLADAGLCRAKILVAIADFAAPTTAPDAGEWLRFGDRMACDPLRQQLTLGLFKRESGDSPGALVHLETAAKAGSGDAALFLGQWFLYGGYGQRIDLQRSVPWLELAVERGLAIANSSLADAMSRRDDRRGVAEHARLACDAGVAVNCLTIAIMQYRGEEAAGIARDRAAAVATFRRYRDTLPDAAYWLGLHQVMADPPEADEGIANLKLALRRGQPAAAFLLGGLALEGRVVAKDPEEALRYMRIAARGGVAGAAEAVARLERGETARWTPPVL